MDLTGCYFKYNNISSGTYGLVFAHCDTSEYTAINGETSTITLYNKRNYQRLYIDDDFSTPISFEAEICTVNTQPLSVSDVVAVEQWLFNKYGYYPLEEDPVGGIVISAYSAKRLRCRFVNPHKIYAAGGVVGFSFTVECDSAFASRTYTTNLNPAISAINAFSINVKSDIPIYVYPKITIGSVKSSSLIIYNSTDDPGRLFTFSGLTPDIQVTIDSRYNTVSGGNYSKLIHRNFPRLLPGNNVINIEGSISGNIGIYFETHEYL